MHRHYDWAGALILPSLMENYPYAALEGLSRGCFLLGSDVGGIPEIIRHGENGLLVRPDEPEALEAAVAAFHADHELCARVAAANQLRAREFSAATMTGRYAGLYRDVAARQNAGLTLP